MSEEKQENKERIKSPVSEIIEVITILGFTIFAIFIFILQPKLNWTVEVMRGIDIASTMLQVIGVVIMAFKFLRTPLRKQQIKDYFIKKKEIVDRFKDDPRPGTKHTLKNELHALKKKYAPVLDFGKTVKTMYWVGLIFVIIGYGLKILIT